MPGVDGSRSWKHFDFINLTLVDRKEPAGEYRVRFERLSTLQVCAANLSISEWVVSWRTAFDAIRDLAALRFPIICRAESIGP